MDLVDSPGDSYQCFEEEADIIYAPQDVENHDDDDQNHPSRPISRLGFNRPALPAGPPERYETHNSEAIQWSRSLFQSVGISELRLSTLKTHSGNVSELVVSDTSSAHSTSDVGENSIPILSGSMEHFESPYGNTADDMVKYTKVDRKSPSTPPLSVSRLSFPFVTTPSSRRNKTPLRPSRRHKYSCFPSLMSPEPAAHPFPSHQRHSYRQHGYSRLALQNLKWFWSVREHERTACNTDLHIVNACDDGSPDTPLVQPSVVHPFNRVPTPFTHSPMTIYPRRGNIAALHDPHSFHIDRCFAGFANWTIGKILWMLDMHAAMEKRKMEANMEHDVSDEESESELETSGFSEDSDCTLVESEDESDFLTLRNTMLDSSISMFNNGQAAADPPQIVSVGYFDNTRWSQSVYTYTSTSGKSDRDNLPWATNWCRRWALLIDISRVGKDRKRLIFESDRSIGFIPKNDTGPHSILAGKRKYLANDEL